jgi:hypothetical protein
MSHLGQECRRTRLRAPQARYSTRVVNTLLACIVEYGEVSNTISIRASLQKECLRISNLTDRPGSLRIGDGLKQNKAAGAGAGAGQGCRTRMQDKEAGQGCRTRMQNKGAGQGFIVGNWPHRFVV